MTRVPVAFDCCNREATSRVATTVVSDGNLVRNVMLERDQAALWPLLRGLPSEIEWLSDNGLSIPRPHHVTVNLFKGRIDKRNP